MAAKKSATRAKPKKPATAKAASSPGKSARKSTSSSKKPAKAPAAATSRPARSANRPSPSGKPVNAAQKIPKSVPKTIQPPPGSTYDPAEDAETNETLLSGPRNVQPYIVKRGEQYMSKEQHEHFRRILLNWKRDLMLEVDRTVSHMKDEAANFPDPNDRATQEEEFSLELRTRDRERKLIRKIDEALARIEDGSYGYCLETGEPIGVKRLEARPVATLSIEAQERRERREKQYGDRDDRYR
jgi:DnaK suppressor protein